MNILFKSLRHLMRAFSLLLKAIRVILYAVFYTTLLPWILLIIIIFIALFLSLGIPALLPYLVVAITFVIIISAMKIRQQLANAILNYINQAIQLNLPIDYMLNSAALSEQGTLRIRIRALRRELADGNTIANSLRLTVPEIKTQHIKLIQAAENIGQLAPTLKQIQINNQLNTNRQTDQLTALAYPIALLVGLIFIFILIAQYVIPQFVDILQDFNAPPPKQLIMLSQFIDNNILTINVLAIIISQTLIIIATWALFKPKWLTLGPLRRYTDALIFHTPLLRTLATDRGLTQVLPLLADATASGIPLESALAETTSLKINHSLIKQLQHCQQQLTQGASLQKATQQARLPNFLVQMLATTTKTASLPQTLHYLARYYQHRHTKTQITIQNAIAPVTILILGLVVGWFAVAILGPIFNLIDLTAQSTGLM